MQVHFKPRAHHAHGIEDAGLIVENELPRQQVQNLAVRRALDGPRTFHGGAHVFAGNLAHAAAQVESAVGIETANMRPAHTHHALIDIGVRHPLGALDGRLHCFGGRSEVRDKPFAHPRRLHHSVAAIAQCTLVQVGRQHARPGAANVEYNDQVVLLLAHRSGLTDPALPQRPGGFLRRSSACFVLSAARLASARFFSFILSASTCRRF